MSSKRIIIGIVFLISIIAAVLSASYSNLQFIGNKESTVRIMKNGDVPLYGEKRVILEKELTIGKGSAKTRRTAFITDIEVRRDGGIYTLDSNSGCITSFDSRGHYLANIGEVSPNSEGVSDALDIALDTFENIYLLTSTNIMVYNPERHLIKRIPLEENVREFSVSPEGFFLTRVRAEDGVQEIVLIGEDGKRKETIASFSGFRPSRLRDQKGSLYLIASALYHPALHSCSVGRGGLAFGYSSEYRITILDAKGNQVLIIEKAESPRLMTQREKQQLILEKERSFAQRAVRLRREDLISAMQLPDTKPYFEFLLSDGTHIYSGQINNEKKWTVDIFDEKGIYTDKFNMDLREIIKISNGKIYCLSSQSPSWVDRYRFQLLEK